MSKQRHIIGRTVLEIESDRLDDMWSFQNDISDLLHQRVVPEMERLFDQWVGADEVIRLDRVVVEVDPVDRHFLADEFVRNLLEAMDRTLSDRLANRVSIAADTETIWRDRAGADAGGVSMAADRAIISRDRAGANADRLSMSAESEVISRDRAGADWEVLLYFLQYGRLPWWCLTEDWQSWISRWEAVMQEGSRWQAPLRELLISYPPARQRLVAQLSEGFLHQMVLQLQPTWGSWSTLLAQARSLMQSLGLRSSTVQQLQTQAWIILLAELGQEASQGRALPTTRWMRNWLAELIQTWQPESLAESEQGLPTEGSEDLSHLQSRPGFVLNHRVELAYQRLHPLIASIPMTERSLWLDSLDQVIPRPPTAPPPELPQQESTPNASEAISEDLESDMEQPVEMPEVVDLNAHSGNRSERADSSLLSPEEEAAGLFVNQAGLVILHPFLQIYFEDVGLLEGEEFRDEVAQQTAIYLLHYLATGQTDAPEYELVLPKLLCGWSLSEPVIRGLLLPDAALIEGENLLQAAIDYWQALKSTSPDGLREGFLQREGKLTRLDEGDWRLQVEQQAIDVLLGSLPWGLSVVKLPWMASMLMVEWS